VSSSYVALSTSGSSAEIEVRSNAEWAFEASSVPEWLTVSPMSGGSGNCIVKLTASATETAQNATLRLICGNNIQEINVIQGKTVAELATCKQIIEGDDGKTFRVRAAITSIANAHYGNIYINDGTGEVYLYGTNDKDGKPANDPVDSWGLEVGDVITVEGPKKTYNGTVELTNVTVLSVEKSLVKIIEPVVAPTIAKEGGHFTVKVAFKGKGVIPGIADGCDWINFKTMSIKAGTPTAVEPNPADTAYVTFTVAVNESNLRSSYVTFTSTNGIETSSITYDVIQEGSVADVTVAEFLAAEVGTAEYRLTGVITELYASDKQGKSFYIADHTGTTLVYRAEGFIESGAKVGDVVTVVGQRGAYKESPQMVSGTLEKVNYSATAVTINEFRNLPDDKEKYYIISGTINKVAEADKGAKDDIEKYGNFDLTDTTGSVYIYGVLKGWGGAKGQFGELGLTYGDQLTIIAYKTTYKGLVEGVGVYLSSKKANQ
jgi:RPA family protein